MIRIIREEDEPKPALIARFTLTDNQAEAILNMRLRALRKLEEMEIRGEHQKLTQEQKALNALLKSDDDQWATISEEIKAVKEKFSKKTPLGRRRTDFSEAPEIDLELEQSMIEKEPVTVVCSEKGWIRTMKGHMEDVSGLTYKDGDKGEFTFHAMSTDKVMLFSSSGKFFTLDVGKLPGGRGHGEPVRLMCDLDAADSIVSLKRRVSLWKNSSHGFGMRRFSRPSRFFASPNLDTYEGGWEGNGAVIGFAGRCLRPPMGIPDQPNAGSWR